MIRQHEITINNLGNISHDVLKKDSKKAHLVPENQLKQVSLLQVFSVQVHLSEKDTQIVQETDHML